MIIGRSQGLNLTLFDFHHEWAFTVSAYELQVESSRAILLRIDQDKIGRTI